MGRHKADQVVVDSKEYEHYNTAKKTSVSFSIYKYTKYKIFNAIMK